MQSKAKFVYCAIIFTYKYLFIMSVNKKLLKYLDYKEISQRKFTATCKLSEGVLRGGKNLGSGYLNIIKQNYPDLNMDWLLFDDGNMLLKEKMIVNEARSNYGLDAEIEHLRELLKAKDETITILKHQLGINNGKSKAS